MVVNRDAASLRKAAACRKVWLDAPKGDRESLVRAVREQREALLDALDGAPGAVLLLGLGGCTGSWAGPEVAGLLREAGRRLLAFAAMPFDFGGQERRARAEHACGLLEAAAHRVIRIENQRLIQEAPHGASMQEAFSMVDREIADMCNPDFSRRRSA